MENWDILTTDEKQNAIKSLIKSLQFYKFNVQKELEAELTLPEPSQTTLDNCNQILFNINIKENYYNSQLDALSQETAQEV